MKRFIPKIFFFFAVIITTNTTRAQDLIKSIPTERARFISTDALGNVYLVREDNTLIRYNSNGDSTANYINIRNGDLMQVDATNTLKILLYYPAFSKIVLVDNTLSVKNELDLTTLGIYNSNAIGMSADGKTWVYDNANAVLKKIDDQLNITNAGNDMRQESQTVPNPSSLIERDGKVYLCDPQNGIYTFDRFATYLNTLEILDVNQLQVFGTHLVYQENDTLKSYNQQTLALKTIPLPKSPDFIQARMERNRMYFLYKHRLEIYHIADGSEGK